MFFMYNTVREKGHKGRKVLSLDGLEEADTTTDDRVRSNGTLFFPRWSWSVNTVVISSVKYS